MPADVTRECPSCSAILAAEAAYCIDCGSPTSPGSTGNAPADGDELRGRLSSALGEHFTLERLLGRGGMGAVYLANDLLLHRKVAIKVLPPEVALQTSGSRERFTREARAAAQLTHRHIVPLHSIGESDGTLYFVMGFVDGESLRSVLNREGSLSEDRTRRVLGELADGLAYAHARGIVHRDIKPDNVMMERSTGNAILTDFGIARYAADAEPATAGFVFGTPEYMSPEQAAGDLAIDGRSDIYSLGVLGFRAVSGRLPFEGTGVRELLLKHLTEDPPKLRSVAPQVSGELASAIDRCLAKEPADRWPTAADFGEAVASARRMEKLVEKRAWYDGVLFSYMVPVLFFLSVFVVAGTVGEHARAPVESSLERAHSRHAVSAPGSAGHTAAARPGAHVIAAQTEPTSTLMGPVRWLVFGSATIPKYAVRFYATTFVTTVILSLASAIILFFAALARPAANSDGWKHTVRLVLRQPHWWTGWAPSAFRHPAMTDLSRRYPLWIPASRTVVEIAALYYVCIVLPAVVVIFETSASDLTDASLQDWPYVRQWLNGGSLLDRDAVLPLLAAGVATASFAWAVRAGLRRSEALRVANGDVFRPRVSSLEFAAAIASSRVIGL